MILISISFGILYTDSILDDGTLFAIEDDVKVNSTDTILSLFRRQQHVTMAGIGPKCNAAFHSGLLVKLQAEIFKEDFRVTRCCLAARTVL